MIQNIKKIICEGINDIAAHNVNTNPKVKWALIKGRIRDETIKYASAKKKINYNIERETIKYIELIQNDLYKDSSNITLINKYKEEKQKLEEINDNKIKGILIRTKAVWIEGAEKNTKYFASLEKKRAEQKIIKQLKINNNIETNGSILLGHIKEYYQHLYSKQNDFEDDTGSDFFINNNNPHLVDEDRAKYGDILIEHECANALKEMNNNKSPGSDGITTEFYKIFWPNIKTYLVESLNYSYQTESLSELQTQSIISLLPKKDKDVLDINNWRPVSLLNVDYKIATKTIANRIKGFLHKIISPNQTGFLKGRYIGENVRIIQEIIENVNSQDKSGLILFTDFQKAFDSIDHKFMFESLNQMGFSQSIINWVKLFL